MRSWNYVTLEQIVGHVTSAGSPTQKSASPSWRPKITPVILAAAAVMICSTPGQLQPSVSRSDSTLSVPLAIVEKTHRVRPQFLDAFAEYFEPSFANDRKRELDRVALLGSSLDLPGESGGVVSAIASFPDREEWKPRIR